jgi:hypothetical protein
MKRPPLRSKTNLAISHFDEPELDAENAFTLIGGLLCSLAFVCVIGAAIYLLAGWAP